MLFLFLLACQGYLLQPYAPAWDQISVGHYDACAHREDGYVRCASPFIRASEDPILSGAKARATHHRMSGVAVGEWRACTVFDGHGDDAGPLRCWGDSDDDAWPSDDLPRLDAASLDMGANWVCGLRAGPADGPDTAESGEVGDVWCGSASGQTKELPGPFDQVVVGDDFACTLDFAGSVSCSVGTPTPFALSEVLALTASSDGLCWRTTDGLVSCQRIGDSSPTEIRGLPKDDTRLSLGAAGLCSWTEGEKATCVGALDSELRLVPTKDTKWKSLELSTSLPYACGVTKAGTLSCFGASGLTPAFAASED